MIKSSLIAIVALMLTSCGNVQEKIDYNNPDFNYDVRGHRVINIDIDKMVHLMNIERLTGFTCDDVHMQPVGTLRLDGRLMQSALEKAYDLALSGVFSHDGSGENSDRYIIGTPLHFARLIRHHSPSKVSVGENIGYGFKDVKSLHDAMMNSKEHCMNVMNPRFNNVGISTYKDEYNNYYWTQHFSN